MIALPKRLVNCIHVVCQAVSSIMKEKSFCGVIHSSIYYHIHSHLVEMLPSLIFDEFAMVSVLLHARSQRAKQGNKLACYIGNLEDGVCEKISYVSVFD